MTFKTRDGTAILKPAELKMIIASIPREKSRVKFEAALYSGMRYSELMALKKHKEDFNAHDKSILVRSKKVKTKTPLRYVHLNDLGVRAFQRIISDKLWFPSRTTWDENLKKWAVLAGVDPAGFSAKSLRKTYECYLVVKYTKLIEQIFLSQGHVRDVALKHYLSFSFSDQDILEMDEYVRGWRTSALKEVERQESMA